MEEKEFFNKLEEYKYDPEKLNELFDEVHKVYEEIIIKQEQIGKQLKKFEVDNSYYKNNDSGIIIQNNQQYGKKEINHNIFNN